MLIRPDGISATQKTHGISGADIKLMMQYEELVRRLGWEPFVVCPQCGVEFGPHKDGVRARTNDTSFEIECAHQKYVFGASGASTRRTNGNGAPGPN